MLRKLFYIDDRATKQRIKDALEQQDAVGVVKGLLDLGASKKEIQEIMGYMQRLLKANSLSRAASIIDMRYKDYSPRIWWFLATLPLRIVFVRK